MSKHCYHCGKRLDDRWVYSKLRGAYKCVERGPCARRQRQKQRDAERREQTLMRPW